MNDVAPLSLETLFEKMHDIEGLDPISLWPLAIGWWVMIGFLFLIFSISVWYFLKWLTFRRSWKYETIKQLNSLLDDLSKTSITHRQVQQIAAFFSEYLRRIALQRFPRKACAGLTGDAWLNWLKSNDQNQFDWLASGKLLNSSPYAPIDKFVEYDHELKNDDEIKNISAQLIILIQAAKEWVR